MGEGGEGCVCCCTGTTYVKAVKSSCTIIVICKGALRAVAELIAEGKVGELGLSNFPAWQVAQVITCPVITCPVMSRNVLQHPFLSAG